jgi:hypothetical protein
MGRALFRVGPEVTHLDPLQRFRHTLAIAGGEAPGDPTPECLDDDLIAALAEGTLATDARQPALSHVVRCPRCRSAVASVARALTDAGIAREVAAVEGVRHGRWLRVARVALPLAAASIVLVVSWQRTPRHIDSQHRAPTITAAPAPTPLAPVGAVAAARRLVWSTVLGADRYRITVFDSTGVVVFETESVDTTVVLPGSVALASGRKYLWKVEARTDIGRWSASDLVEFSIPTGPSQ